MGDKTSFLWATSHNLAGRWRRDIPVALLFAALGGAAAAQGSGWQWLDATGRKVYSDLPPPSSVPDRSILQRPSGAAGVLILPAAVPPGASEVSQPAKPAATPGRAAAAKPGKTGESMPSDAELHAAVEKRNAEIRQENCQRARDALASLASGTRLLASNARGEPVVMDEALRAAEMRRMQRSEQENCRPAGGTQ